MDINENLNDIKNVTATVVGERRRQLSQTSGGCRGQERRCGRAALSPAGVRYEGGEGGRRAIGSARKGPHQRGCRKGTGELRKVAGWCT